MRLVSDDHSNDSVRDAILGLLRDSELCSIASRNLDGTVHANTAFFAVDGELNLFFLSDPTATHCQNILATPAVALTVFDSSQHWGESLRGVQLSGEARALQGEEANQAEAAYGARFASYREYMDSLSVSERAAFPSRFFSVRLERMKILDEDRFGEESYVTATVER